MMWNPLYTELTPRHNFKKSQNLFRTEYQRDLYESYITETKQVKETLPNTGVPTKLIGNILLITGMLSLSVNMVYKKLKEEKEMNPAKRKRKE